MSFFLRSRVILPPPPKLTHAVDEPSRIKIGIRDCTDGRVTAVLLPQEVGAVARRDEAGEQGAAEAAGRRRGGRGGRGRRDRAGERDDGGQLHRVPSHDDVASASGG